MGLDCYAYSQIKLIEAVNKEYKDDIYKYDGEPNTTLLFANHKDFFRQAPEFVSGAYTYENSDHERMGSYSSYNWIREELCKAVLDVTPHAVWNDEGRFKDEPLFHVICFTDCDGILDAKMCKRLLKEFEDTRPKWSQIPGDYAAPTWTRFMDLLKIGADDGVVEFS